MKRISLSILLFSMALSCAESVDNTTEPVVEISAQDPVSTSINPTPVDEVTANGITVSIYDFESFKSYLHRSDDKMHVINFWATWCKPCVAELPAFEALGAKHSEIEITLVSLDFLKAIESSLIPFIIKNELQSNVIVMHDPDGNSWIPQIDENWSGAIPATIIYKNDQREFYEKSFSLEELEQELIKFN